MAALVIYGPPQSSYVRTTRMTCVEKGVDHQLEPIEFGSAGHLERHPFGKVPTISHGDVRLWETSAIIRYIDSAFDGPSLVPSDPAAQGVMEQWVSTLNCYLYDDLVRNYALQYIIPSMKGKDPDREKIDAAQDNLKRDFALLEKAYDGKEWIAGSFSLADLVAGPILTTALMFPEAQALFDKSPSLKAALGRLRDRDSARFIDVPKPS